MKSHQTTLNKYKIIILNGLFTLMEICVIAIAFYIIGMMLALWDKAQAAPLAPIIQAVERAQIPAADRPIMIALARVESNYDTNAIGRAGEIGAWQLHPKYHKVPPTPALQAAYAYRLLLTYKRLCGNLLERALACYNLGPAKAIKMGFLAGSGYARKVLDSVIHPRPNTPDQGKVRLTANAE